MPSLPSSECCTIKGSHVKCICPFPSFNESHWHCWSLPFDIFCLCHCDFIRTRTHTFYGCVFSLLLFLNLSQTQKHHCLSLRGSFQQWTNKTKKSRQSQQEQKRRTRGVGAIKDTNMILTPPYTFHRVSLKVTLIYDWCIQAKSIFYYHLSLKALSSVSHGMIFIKYVQLGFTWKKKRSVEIIFSEM